MIRCEVEGCRGNSPCAACMVALSAALDRGLAVVLPGKTPGAQETRRFVLAKMKKELDLIWGKTIAGKGVTRRRSTKS